MTLIAKVRYWAPTILWAGVIFGFSSGSAIPTSQIYWQEFVIKKTAHIFVYFVLAILVYRSLRHTAKFSSQELLWTTSMITVLYAVSDEFHQSFTPGREPKLRDIIFDSIGALAGLYVVARAKLLRPFV